MAFSFRAGTNWCHDFPKLARESGFYFNMHGSRVRVDWNRISAIDIDRVIRERDFLTIDANINNVIDYCLESEYDVKILDPNFVKLFRLAQLSVEYLLYCKQYLDHSVIILKDELRQKIEQNVSMKKEIATLEDTLRNLKERSREKRKLIETSFGEISNGEIYKCPHCPKTFVRAIFVNAHIARKHPYLSDFDVSTSPVHEHYRAETEKLHNEIKTLKERLNQTERVIRNESDKILDNTEKMYINNINKSELDKVFQEQKRYQEDIGSLKSILFDEIRALKEKDHTANESILETNVKTLISQQEKEIENLRNQLLERVTPDVENMQVKLQTQENYWKAKIEDMETVHHRDIERLTAELKVTQQVADRIKSEYAVKVHDLEKQSMDQSNILVEQRKQLNNLSREISNSQTQINNYRTREKDKAEKFHESPLLKIKHDGSYNNSETYHKSSNSEMVIEDIGSECSQEYSDKSIAMQSKYVSNKNNTVESENNRKLITDLSRTTDHVTAMSNLKNLERSNVRKTKDKPKYYNTLDDENEIIDYTSKNFTAKGNIPTDIYKKYADIRNVERKKILHSNNMGNSKNSKFLEKHSVINSATESASSSSISESESETESVTVDNDVMIKKYETSAVKSSNARNLSIQEEVQTIFDNRLRELGIDPEWRGIPAATFKQKMEIIKHQQNINTKKLARYAQIKQTILEDLFQKISTNHKESKYTMLTKHSPLNKLITHTRSKALKAFSDHKDNDEYTSVQKTENTTPSKLRLKQKIELLPKKYKDNEAFENTHESPLKRNGVDGSSPKVTPTYPRFIRNISSSSSIETQEDIKQISSTKITVSDSSRKISSPISRKQILASKLAENDDSDSTIIKQDESVLSPTNNKSVLKPMTGSVGSLVKKKVLFDLEDRKVDFDGTTIPENDQRTHQISDHDWNISSFPERDEYALRRQKSMSTSNIILKTSQSDKIAEISKKIQEQLSIAKKPPVGSVETIFRSNMNSQDLTNYNANNQLLSSNLTGAISESSMPNLTSTNTKSGIFPQPAPRTRKDKDPIVLHREHELKYSDLDSDIDEILQME